MESPDRSSSALAGRRQNIDKLPGLDGLFFGNFFCLMAAVFMQLFFWQGDFIAF